MTSRSQIYYWAPDNDKPSWGIGLLYHHVRLLRQAGFEAWVLHRTPPFRISWMEADVPILYLEESAFALQPDDFLVKRSTTTHSATRPRW